MDAQGLHARTKFHPPSTRFPHPRHSTVQAASKCCTCMHTCTCMHGSVSRPGPTQHSDGTPARQQRGPGQQAPNSLPRPDTALWHAGPVNQKPAASTAHKLALSRHRHAQPVHPHLPCAPALHPILPAHTAVCEVDSVSAGAGCMHGLLACTKPDGFGDSYFTHSMHLPVVGHNEKPRSKAAGYSCHHCFHMHAPIHARRMPAR